MCIRDSLRVDSLAYLSLEGLREAAGDGGRYCDACFTGDYPVSFTADASKDVFDRHAASGDILVKPLPPDEDGA